MEAQEKYNIFNKSILKTLIFCIFLLLATVSVFHIFESLKIRITFLVLASMFSIAFIFNKLKSLLMYLIYFIFTGYICIIGFIYFVRAFKDIESISFILLTLAGSIYALTVFDNKRLKILYSLIFIVLNALVISLILLKTSVVIANISEIIGFMICNIIVKKTQERRREDML